MEENLNEMVIENTINEVEENLTDEIIQNSTKRNGVVTRLVIGGVALVGADEFIEEETETEDLEDPII